jgi:hypothetical protein
VSVVRKPQRTQLQWLYLVAVAIWGIFSGSCSAWSVVDIHELDKMMLRCAYAVGQVSQPTGAQSSLLSGACAPVPCRGWSLPSCW